MSQVRITAGALRGRRVSVPRGDVRPTSERARQAYFNIIAGRIEGARFLDLFAGSGIFSFEAVSRGAESALAVDQSRQNVAAIEELAKRLSAKIETIAGDALATIHRLPDREFDLVYADPPYAYDRYADLVMALDSARLSPGAIVALEHRRGTSPFTVAPAGLEFWRRAEYGEVWMTFFKRPQHLQ